MKIMDLSITLCYHLGGQNHLQSLVKVSQLNSQYPELAFKFSNFLDHFIPCISLCHACFWVFHSQWEMAWNNIIYIIFLTQRLLVKILSSCSYKLCDLRHMEKHIWMLVLLLAKCCNDNYLIELFKNEG